MSRTKLCSTLFAAGFLAGASASASAEHATSSAASAGLFAKLLAPAGSVHNAKPEKSGGTITIAVSNFDLKVLGPSDFGDEPPQGR